MKISHLLLPALALCGTACPALAARNPTPPPSGIVIHLFGPNSIMSNITPDLPGETAKPAPGQPGTAQPGSAQVAAGAPGTPAAPQPAGDENTPTMHDILHQMFVVGDPNHPNQPSPGRAADRPPTGD